MNHSAQNSVMGTDSLLVQSELCEVCSGKDDEDLYIVFNALYRIVSGDIFYQGSESIENELIMNPLPASLAHQKQRSLKTSQEKLQLFKKKLSSQGLLDLVALPRFDLLLREIFKSKYNRVQDTSCKHQELAMNFIRNFNLKNDEFLENSDMNKRKLMENTEKLDMLYNKIKQLKSEIESYHSEIDGLSERIVKKLLPNNSHFISKKLNVCNEDRDDSDDQGSDDDDFADKKLTSSNDSINANNSTGISSESSTSDEEKLERKHKKSKTATFKSKLPKKATDVLKNWFLNNIQNPYPSHEAKETLSKMTGLTRKQIQNWFTNSRKRFLEPLKKKIDGQKLGKDGSFSLDQAGDLFTSETQSQVDPTDSVCPSMSQEPIIVSQTLSQQSQSKPSALSFTPPLQILNDSATKASSFQNSPPQLSPQSAHQPILYPQTNNIVVVPWVLPQAVYPYRPGFPNLLSMNTPPLIPLQQNNYPSNYPLMDPSAAALQNQFSFAIQPNLMDANTMMKQQLSNNFNAINANLYNNFAHPGSVGQLISANQERMSLLNKMSPYATPMGMNSDPALYKLASEGLHRSTSGLFHPRPDLSEIGILGKKYLHKDEYLRANLG